MVEEVPVEQMLNFISTELLVILQSQKLALMQSVYSMNISWGSGTKMLTICTVIGLHTEDNISITSLAVFSISPMIAKISMSQAKVQIVSIHYSI